MAALAVDRVSQRLDLGGDMPAPHSAWAFDRPAGRRNFRFVCVPCILEKEAWPASASGENICELHFQLNIFNATLASTFDAAGRSHRRVKLTGSDLRSLADSLLDDNEDVLR